MNSDSEQSRNEANEKAKCIAEWMRSWVVDGDLSEDLYKIVVSIAGQNLLESKGPSKTDASGSQELAHDFLLWFRSKCKAPVYGTKALKRWMKKFLTQQRKRGQHELWGQCH